MGKEYVLELQRPKKGKSFIKKVDKRASFGLSSNQVTRVSRADISHYRKNPTQVWRDISITPLKGGKGFKVTRVSKNSKMAALGLMKGDVIIRANNVDSVSYKDALELYQNIDTIDEMQIVVLRNNQEKELVYEIN